MPPPLPRSPAWQDLAAHAAVHGGRHLRELFAVEPTRTQRMTHRLGDLTIDLSKHRVTAETIDLLVALAEERRVRERLDATMRGEHVNSTEDRPALHTALRAPDDLAIPVDGQDVVPGVHETLRRMRELSDDVRGGGWTGATGEPIATVVNIGIGGSDLGPRMAVQALRDHADGPEVRFVSNVDPDDLWTATHDLDPATTLFVVVSKSFSTLETLTNASEARRWCTDALGQDAVSRHFVAVSSNPDRAAEFGIDPQTVIGFEDWVGGRYSVDSAVGLSLMIAIGADDFAAFLGGFRTVDEHVASAPFVENVPVLMALLQVWYGNLLGAQSQAVLPYAARLARFPAYLQQLEMESNGKRVDLEGRPVAVDTGAVVWGQPGTDGQHAFFQLLHQGTRLVPVDLIGVVRGAHELGDQHELLLANLLAQGEALAFGRTAAEVAAAGVDPVLVPHRTFPGNRPSTTILADELTPAVLGQLIALYEHKVAVLAAIWRINAYDQWGVELGKTLATTLAQELAGDAEPDDDAHDASTLALLRHVRVLREHPDHPAT